MISPFRLRAISMVASYDAWERPRCSIETMAFSPRDGFTGFVTLWAGRRLTATDQVSLRGDLTIGADDGRPALRDSAVDATLSEGDGWFFDLAQGIERGH